MLNITRETSVHIKQMVQLLLWCAPNPDIGCLLANDYLKYASNAVYSVEGKRVVYS